MARSDPEAARRADGISVFLVPRASAGLTITPLPKLGMRALNSCAVHLQEVFATLYHNLGIDPSMKLIDPNGRPQ